MSNRGPSNPFPRIVLALLTAVAFAACTTTDPYTGEEEIDPVPTAAAGPRYPEFMMAFVNA